MAYNLFQRNMSEANKDLGKTCGEEFEVIKNGIAGSYTALSIGGVSKTVRGMAGGRFADASLSLRVLEKVLLDAQIVQGTVLKVGGDLLRVMTVMNPRDGSKRIICGPAAINTPRP